MSDMRDEMLRTLDRIVEDHLTLKVREACDGKASGNASVATAADAAGPLWAALDEAGFTGIGAGGDEDIAFADAMELVRRAGYHALPAPIAETIMARRLLARSGIEAPAGAITLAPPGVGDLPRLEAGRLLGTAKSVPYGRSAQSAVVASADMLHVLDIREALLARGTNMAGEPRDGLDLARARQTSSIALPDASAVLQEAGALARSLQLSGALGAALDHCLTWVNDRIQFGKPIAKHQAIQHLMAQLAEETAAAGAAADLAVERNAASRDRLAVAIAKARIGEAAGRAANTAHAVFGAMGFTREHQLHYTTRRLWSWRNEFGAEVFWQAEIGRIVSAAGGAGLWPLLTGDAARSPR